MKLHILVAASLFALAMSAEAASPACTLTGLSASIAQQSAKVKVEPSWQAQIDRMLAFYYRDKPPSLAQATCPAKPYLMLAGRLAMSPKIISAQAVMQDMPEAARTGELYRAMHRLVMEATEPDTESQDAVDIDALATTLIARSGARPGDEYRYAAIVIRGGMYDDEIAVNLGLRQLQAISAAPSVIASVRQSAKEIRERVMEMREEKD